MMRDLDLGARLSVAPIVREPDGLAMSSRNVYLNPAQRARAAGIPRALATAARLARTGVRDARRLEAAARSVLRRDARPERIDYLRLVNPRTLEPVRRVEGRALLLAAVRIGATRLLDNRFVTVRRGSR
jgi:pantoate--beta-alanine ligase